MPRVRFITNVEGDATNRAGFAAGSEWDLSDAEAAARLERGEIELVDRSARAASAAAPLKSAAKAAGTPLTSEG